MLALKVNNVYLDLDTKTAVTINLENPIFDRDGIERVYSYPFQIKNNSRNVRALEFANRIDSSAKVKRPAILYLENNVFESGILVVTGSTDKVINVTFQNEGIDLFNSLDSVQLQDIDLPVRIADDYCPDITLGGTFPSPENLKTAVALKINGLVYIGLKSNLIFMVNQINLAYPGLVSLVTLPGVPPNGGYEGIKVHCIEGIEDITVEYDFNDPLQPNEERMDVLVIDHYLEDYANEVGTIVSTGEFEELRFPVVRMPQLYDGANPGYTGYANYINASGDVDLTPGEIASVDPLSWGTTMLPFPRLYWLLQQYGQEYGFAIGGNLWNIPEMRDELIVWTNRPAEKLITTLDKPVVNVSTGNIRLIDAVIQVNKHLPEESIRSLISRVINTFCGFLVFRAGTLRFQLIRPMLRNRPDDWSQYADPEYTNDIQENEGYSLDYEREKGEAGIAGQLERIDGGADAQEFIPGFYTLYDDLHQHRLGPTTFRRWLTAYTSEIGLSEAFDKSQETSFRLMFYRGIQVENNGTSYPMATHGRRNYIGEQVGDYRLSWDGDGGLLYWWEDYINLTVKGRTVTKILRLPVQEILALRNWDSVVKKIYNEFGEFSGVVKTVRFKATTTGIGEAEVTFAKL